MYNNFSFFTVHQLSNISILSSTEVEPSDPPSEDWKLLSYRRESYGDIGTETFKPEAARHLAVFSNGTEGYALTLREFMAFGIGKI